MLFTAGDYMGPVISRILLAEPFQYDVIPTHSDRLQTSLLDLKQTHLHLNSSTDLTGKDLLETLKKFNTPEFLMCNVL